jgi:hypothetical protein
LALPYVLAAPGPAGSLFEDATARSGLSFTLRNGAAGEKHQIETMPGGLAAFDYDGDGLTDIFFANGALAPSLEKSGPQWWNRLYRNLGRGRFEDVTERAGVRGEGYSMGAAVGDYDNDSHPDLLVTGVGVLTLYRNQGDGTFEDVTSRSGIRPQPWSIAAGFFDYDNDGRLDLFIVNYVRWDPRSEPFCGAANGQYRTYCHPKLYEGLPNALYRNNGDGTFTDVSIASGIASHIGKGMGLAFADYDLDGLLDVAVANDTQPDFLFRNAGKGRFTERGLAAGVAFNDDGRALSSMGVDFRDMDGDGLPDLFVTALANETFPFYRNLGNGLFADRTYATRLGAATMRFSGWGNGIYDFDNDGRADLFAANGDVNDNSEVFSSVASRQPCLLLRQDAQGRFDPIPVTAPALHRGAAFADFDNDGLTDVVVTRLNEPAILLRNVAKPNRWLGLRLVGTASNRDAIGARVGVAGRWNHVSRSTGYASSSDPRLIFGLGAYASADVEIIWPSGRVQKLSNLAGGRYHTIVER